ncbi:MAG TPA: hypothetical protein VKA98_06420, partial [Nitrososphaeraceae archaeon]|nr:hypothetical protein [Nitrososphaeraceae archaeon]
SAQFRLFFCIFRVLIISSLLNKEGGGVSLYIVCLAVRKLSLLSLSLFFSILHQDSAEGGDRKYKV